ncbi:MAG: hypothetical protein SGI71_00550 [Verrucomicrobiota bacterium]|nr:hypothetical protein [Verrucomicrobiota bacterium]
MRLTHTHHGLFFAWLRAGFAWISILACCSSLTGQNLDIEHHLTVFTNMAREASLEALEQEVPLAEKNLVPRLIEALYEVGRMEEARRISIQYPTFASSRFRYLEIRQELGQDAYDQAWALLEKIETPKDYVEAALLFPSHQYWIQKFSHYERVKKRFFRDIAGFPVEERNRLTGAFATRQAVAGDMDGALRTMAKIAEETQRLKPSILIAQIMVRSKHPRGGEYIQNIEEKTRTTTNQWDLVALADLYSLAGMEEDYVEACERYRQEMMKSKDFSSYGYFLEVLGNDKTETRKMRMEFEKHFKIMTPMEIKIAINSLNNSSDKKFAKELEMEVMARLGREKTSHNNNDELYLLILMTTGRLEEGEAFLKGKPLETQARLSAAYSIALCRAEHYEDTKRHLLEIKDSFTRAKESLDCLAEMK